MVILCDVQRTLGVLRIEPVNPTSKDCTSTLFFCLQTTSNCVQGLFMALFRKKNLVLLQRTTFSAGIELGLGAIQGKKILSPCIINSYQRAIIYFQPFVFFGGSQLVMPRGYSCVCTQDSLLVGSGTLWEMKLGQIKCKARY